MQPAEQFEEVIPERRSFQRTHVALFGRCMLPNQLEIPCQAVDISPGGAGLISAHVPQLGDHAIIYLDHVGRIEGETVRHFKGGFCIQIDCSLRKRQKLADQIANLEGQTEFVPDEQRRSARIAPKNANSELRLEDGRSYPITIIDISLSGAAISMEVKPALGSHVWLAGMQGTVIRHFAEGIGMQFATTAPGGGKQRQFGQAPVIS